MEGSLQASVPLRVLVEKRMRTVISSGLGVYPAQGDFTKVFATAVTKKKGLRGEQVDELLEASFSQGLGRDTIAGVAAGVMAQQAAERKPQEAGIKGGHGPDAHKLLSRIWRTLLMIGGMVFCKSVSEPSCHGSSCQS